MGVFDKRINYKPFEYPEILQFTEAINKSFWVHSEVDFTADIQDFHSQISEQDRNAVKNSLLAIAQIEVAVKTFWGNLYKHMPKPEMNGLGATFAECEFRHSEAYSRLLEVLGYNDEFEKVIEVPVIRKRIEYLNEALKDANSEDHKAYVMSLLMFSILIENVSLFSQFAIILSFTRFRGYMKNVSNIIAWTSVDEQIHANAGIYLINKIKEEQPELLQENEEAQIYDLIKESINIEAQILDWIFEQGEIPNITKENLLNFMKFRVDDSLVKIGMKPLFNVTNEEYKAMEWFEQEVFANSLDDFFAKRPVDYTKHDKSFSANSLF
ncbi:ribonucleotide-diphosphate reductase subunit beta [Ornithobacterium rhinotracheale]|uniref:ribonucleoside-diphosphate reductase n=2 Tax=Ornithobacterium rhinotracheale TaxID=28251 RepID=I4A0S6_ORNRL|nr:ribonucleotide-diphosphate reductase subunit beta [Ornithobacterium rhinotracheale]AFL97560.1 ribonucleotide reductase, beta subunit [Ornithobacterium rhinotracheale DSM 15997]AIP98918.1 ribonucleotide reductase [Ornithobacterium rhinotracheale ORT-UMN 88]KGB66866.1 ribonucleotide reductase [Ornithobacterium rhinotracheale H06-030791]MBN3661883.1 ribonucleotide-diphosphate reductase subunit beta [Ornithobacterium rhinotracheale]MCK0195074.1 ribonucleotide-diphosphate reductase subunit beta 